MFALAMIQRLGQVIILTVVNLRVAYLAQFNIVNNSDEEKWKHIGYEISFDSIGL